MEYFYKYFEAIYRQKPYLSNDKRNYMLLCLLSFMNKILLLLSQNR